MYRIIARIRSQVIQKEYVEINSNKKMIKVSYRMRISLWGGRLYSTGMAVKTITSIGK